MMSDLQTELVSYTIYRRMGFQHDIKSAQIEC